MLQAEYDYELDIEVQREEAYEDGLRVGEAAGREKGRCEGKLSGIQEEKISLIEKKVRRGKDLKTIAEELEEPVENIREIYEAVRKAAPDYDMDVICKNLD